MIKRIALFFLTLATPLLGAALAEDAHDHHESEHQDAFNPSNFIIHHIADAHDIHLWGEGQKVDGGMGKTRRVRLETVGEWMEVALGMYAFGPSAVDRTAGSGFSAGTTC